MIHAAEQHQTSPSRRREGGRAQRTPAPSSDRRSLSPEEADLAERLADHFASHPLSGLGVGDTPWPTATPGAAVAAFDLDIAYPVTDAVPLRTVPALAEVWDSAPVADDETPAPAFKSIPWQRRSLRRSLKVRATAVAYWMLTALIIAAILGTATIALVGWERSMALMARARGDLSGFVSVVDAAIEPLRRH